MSKMTYFAPCVKRSINRRDDEDNHINGKIENNDNNEFMPVTKRMNYLSIENTNNDTLISGSSSSSNCSTTSSLPNEDDSNDSGYQYQGPMKNEKTLMMMNNNGDHNTTTMPIINNNNHENQLMNLEQLYRTYNPSLKLQQNPIYYDANRILFEAHQMRLLRNIKSS
ncbi:uncharacterized protein LOC124489816 isoform X2 [Dermatophagoides farinae]|uniref:uncharacterized protein LOC124489816 isoform X2 n=1 Tax=Dermatophagoides farinae TaxID=6954 RepID=UPI001F0FDA16|nr:putative uncharacterized protein DDB_G0287457 isoform X2 [Dermatophagoides farinae]